MRYCIECGSEYQDSVTQCADCEGSTLVTADEMKQRGLLLPGERDTRRFIRAGTAEDPLTAERISSVLQSQGIPVFSRPRRGGTLDALTTATSTPWWELLVPEDLVERASAVIEQERAQDSASADEAARAAEEEEAETEGAASAKGS